MSKKKSASQLAAELAYYKEHNIAIPEPQKKKAVVSVVTSERTSGLGLGNSKDFGIYIDNIQKREKLITMEDKQLISMLLRGYDSTLQHIIRPDISFDAERIKRYLITQVCNKGICLYSRVRLGVAIHDAWFVKQFSTGNRVYWYDIPENIWTAKELIKCISFRVERLTEILNSIQ